MEERSQFTFYLSFAKAIQRIKKPAERCEAYDSIVNYALYGKEPGDDISDSAAMVFELAKPTFDTARKNAEKMQRSRNKSQERTGNSDVTVTEHADDAVTEKLHSEKEIEVEIEIEKEKDINIPPISPLGGKGGGFVKPSVEEVKAYCQERGNSVDPEAFVAFYESNGWKVGKNPMKNWKSAVITWEKSRKEGNRGRSSENKPVYEPSRVYHSPDAELPEGWHYDN